MGKSKRKMAEARLRMKDDLFKLLSMVASSPTVTSFKVHPGETINVVLYTRAKATIADIPIGEFPLSEAVSYLLSEAVSNGNATVQTG